MGQALPEGRTDEAQAEFLRAATLTRNSRERALLLQRAAGFVRRSTSDGTASGATAAGSGMAAEIPQMVPVDEVGHLAEVE